MNKPIIFGLYMSCFLMTVSAFSQEKRMPVDLSKSIIKWKGTKINYTRKHEGTLSLKSGSLIFKDHKLTGGQFTADMNSIRITDIPPDDIVPVRNLTAHLKADFETKKYPWAVFTILQATYLNEREINIIGDLTIKGIKRKISFKVQQSSQQAYKTVIQINRFDWDIGKNAGWLEKRLVDPEIMFEIEIFI